MRVCVGGVGVCVCGTYFSSVPLDRCRTPEHFSSLQAHAAGSTCQVTASYSAAQVT